MLQPPAAAGEAPRGFYFVASSPAIRPEQVAPELDGLAHRGILKRLGEACMWDASDEIRYRQPDGTVELLTSIIPINNRNGCWVLTSTHTTSNSSTPRSVSPTGRRVPCASPPGSTSC